MGKFFIYLFIFFSENSKDYNSHFFYSGRANNRLLQPFITLSLISHKVEQEVLIVFFLKISHLSILCYYLVAKSSLTLLQSVNCSPTGSSVHGISQARILDWVGISFSRGYPRSRDWMHIPCNGRRILYFWATGKAQQNNTM